jgi:abortive infection bacteriophage resistance protein
MKKVPYIKPALSYTDQLAKLKQRGLSIRDEALFLELLEKKSYFRLSGYWYPFLSDKTKHIFKSGSTFDDVYDIYLFDRSLRQLIVKELEKIEIAVRAKMIYVFSHQFGPFWYTNPSLFKNYQNHASTISKISEEYQRSDAQFINAFRKKYSDPLPPAWTAFEIISFGSISRLFAQIKPGRSKREVGEYFGLDHNTLASWLHGLVYVRNVCAHHSRLWNRVMRIQPSIPLTPKNEWLSNTKVTNNKTYYILSMILYLLNSIDETNSMVEDLKTLFNNYRIVDLTAMGFPKNWKSEILWK